ncbi:hypothetical protein FPQ18DRAFT_305392 [Pyronema domesticum]|nr:hypothetical protein FPQ18DRAFT_305392 [Pyronema domesticum]
MTALNEDHAPLWVAQPPYRGTWGILYSCTIMLGLCVYTAVHINILTPDDTPMTIYMPYGGDTNGINRERDENTTRTRNYKADTNGTDSTVNEECSGAIEGQFIARYNIYDYPLIKVHPNGKSYTTLIPDKIESLAERGIFVHAERKAIEDKSKADLLAKFLVCFQVLWMVIEGYPLALLEVHVFVHVVCALTMYALWFKKPMDIRSTVEIPQEGYAVLIGTAVVVERSNNIQSFEAIQNSDEKTGTDFVLWISLILICGIYGGIHLAAWNSDFPSGTARLLWKISCIVTVSGSILEPGWLLWTAAIFRYGFSFSTKDIITRWPDRRPTEAILLWYSNIKDSASLGIACQVLSCLAIFTSPILIAARLYLVIESFISLRDVPAGVYATVPWAQYIPHILSTFSI